MSPSIFAFGNEPVPDSTQLTAKAVAACRKLELHDITVSPLEFRSAQQWLTRRTQRALSDIADSDNSQRATDLLTRSYVADIVEFMRNVKHGFVTLGLD